MAIQMDFKPHLVKAGTRPTTFRGSDSLAKYRDINSNRSGLVALAPLNRNEQETVSAQTIVIGKMAFGNVQHHNERNSKFVGDCNGTTETKEFASPRRKHSNDE